MSRLDINGLTRVKNKIMGLIGVAGGMASLDANGKVPSSQLPSYVDDVVECDDLASFPQYGETSKIYLAKDTNKAYRWGGTTYVEISSSLALGQTSTTAYRGDLGAVAYSHAASKGSAFTEGLYKITTNSEGHVIAATAVTKADITRLDIPGQDTTYSLATESANGLLSSTDKATLNRLPATLESYALKNNTVLTGSLSLGRLQETNDQNENTTVIGSGSIALGIRAKASGSASIALGYEVEATADCAFAEGWTTHATGGASHSEGSESRASGAGAHAEGGRSTASGYASHAEGYVTTASGYASHAEGSNTTASSNYSHVEGSFNEAIGSNSHAEGNGTHAVGAQAHAEGSMTYAEGTASHAEGVGGTYTEEVDGEEVTKYYGAFGKADHVEGYCTIANSGSDSSNYGAHAEGWKTRATGDCSHAEGGGTRATGTTSHSEGNATKATGSHSHAEGDHGTASGTGSHAEGYTTVASAAYAHAEGRECTAAGLASHAEGYITTASRAGHHVVGRYNIPDTQGNASNSYGKYVEIVGNGTSTTPSNARTVDWSGNEWLAGTLTCQTSITIGNTTITEAQLQALLELATAIADPTGVNF